MKSSKDFLNATGNRLGRDKLADHPARQHTNANRSVTCPAIYQFVGSNIAKLDIDARASQSRRIGVLSDLRAGSTLQALSEASELHGATKSQLTKLDTSFVNAETSARFRRGKH